MPTKRTIIASLFWKYCERLGTQLTQFVVSVVLARILAPDDFGVVALALIFIAIANIFVQSGLNTALIQKKDADDLDFSSVFWASLGISFIAYAVFFFAAPFIADFYGKEILVPVTRVLALTIPIGVLNSIQNAYVSRHMMFKKLFYRSFGAMIPSGIAGIVAALYGAGIWAIVIQQISISILNIAILWVVVPWHPSFKFSGTRLKSLFSFGWKLLCSSLLDACYSNLRGLIIGKVFTPADLAYYNRGDHFPNLVVNNINHSIQSVMLPSLSAYQDDRPMMKKLMRRSIVTTSFLILPMMAGLAVLAKPLILFLLGEKWLPCAPFVQIYCFIYAFRPIHTSNLSAINAMGRSDIFLKLEIIKEFVGIGILLGSLFLFNSPLGIAYGAALATLISAFINAHPNKKLLQYGYLEQMKDIFPSFLLSGFMAVCLHLFSQINIPIYISAILQIPLGIIIYTGIAKILHFECLDYLVNTIKGFRHGR
ncbi:MAG: lipopolysaccharide biosynthesis protein [Fibrobacter sp.]|nr:lipopolysaccharide biosynthesis protein [Fibrobacter sp.]MBR6854530.1 lipopolysaccharide biosynthesis protein [Fibrobacter sp.]